MRFTISVVVFFATASLFALNSSGVATLTTSALPIGNLGIVALYSGGGLFAGSSNGVSQVVTASIPALDGRMLGLLAVAFALCGALLIKR